MSTIFAVLRDALSAALAVVCIAVACMALDPPQPREQIGAFSMPSVR